eukprot:CAMPEP_0201495826 /NCGR_PEP_ID=MMETSP0151_2-20130828/56301_1 /ASSEMBLY_ACC=CAM_ASM_000257 /TAXON_ID=200890 /ORGANISM="Paramoeba atlantica, Strain 621/1 / CCAP 1560/9" /LENGTH=165 /DNA_ID=CAMNT_0047885149 /DNA_START=37 /DNA_END=530 /DNA_ORIENTATION=+
MNSANWRPKRIDIVPVGLPDHGTSSFLKTYLAVELGDYPVVNWKRRVYERTGLSRPKETSLNLLGEQCREKLPIEFWGLYKKFAYDPINCPILVWDASVATSPSLLKDVLLCVDKNAQPFIVITKMDLVSGVKRKAAYWSKEFGVAEDKIFMLTNFRTRFEFESA